jgi:TrmH family RNA methyltransferase
MNENRKKMFRSLAHAKYRRMHRLFLVEGAHAVEELLKSDWNVESVMASDPEAYSSLISSTRDTRIEQVSQKDLNRIATTTTPQDILAVARIPENDLRNILLQDRILIADGLRDPANMGTIIRTAAAFGFGAIITTAGSVDIFNPKVVRATQGAMFAIDIARRITIREILGRLHRSHTIYALSAGGDEDLQKIRIDRRAALIVGAEIAGVSEQLLKVSHHKVRIPISTTVESLNAAVAAGIAMFLFSRSDI